MYYRTVNRSTLCSEKENYLPRLFSIQILLKRQSRTKGVISASACKMCSYAREPSRILSRHTNNTVTRRQLLIFWVVSKFSIFWFFFFLFLGKFLLPLFFHLTELVKDTSTLSNRNSDRSLLSCHLFFCRPFIVIQWTPDVYIDFITVYGGYCRLLKEQY